MALLCFWLRPELSRSQIKDWAGKCWGSGTTVLKSAFILIYSATISALQPGSELTLNPKDHWLLVCFQRLNPFLSQVSFVPSYTFTDLNDISAAVPEGVSFTPLVLLQFFLEVLISHDPDSAELFSSWCPSRLWIASVLLWQCRGCVSVQYKALLQRGQAEHAASMSLHVSSAWNLETKHRILARIIVPQINSLQWDVLMNDTHGMTGTKQGKSEMSCAAQSTQRWSL